MAIGLGKLYGAAARAYDAPLKRLNIYDGAVRSGKTVSAMMRWCRWITTDAPPGTLMISGKTERTVKQNLVDPLMAIFPPRYISYSAGNHELNLLGRRHIIVGANDERAEQKIRGVTLAGVLGDEVTLWAESFFKMTLSRMSVRGAAFLGTTNPDSPMHWLNVEYLQRAHELDLARHIFRLDDNPHLDPAFVRNMKSEYSGLWYKRYIEGKWVLAEGAVYDMFDPEVHTFRGVVPPGTWRVAGVDYGTTNPSVYIALTMVDDKMCEALGLKRGTMIAHDEWRWDSKVKRRQLTAAEHSIEFTKWKKKLGAARDVTGQKVERTDVDPTANGFILQLWRDGERSVRAGDNDVLAGIMEVSSLLHQQRLLFQASTTRTAMEEMASYSWDEDYTMKGEDRPMKVADHAPDALRYAIRGNRAKWRYTSA